MLLCLNCNSTHPDDTVQCPVCRMKNNFRELENLPKDVPSPPKEDGKILCRNCGAWLRETAVDCCPHCRIPIKHTVAPCAKTFSLDTARYTAPGFVASG